MATTKCPAALAALPRPRAVYVGALFTWFDFELLAEFARHRPDAAIERELAQQGPWSIRGTDLLVGQQDADGDGHVVGGAVLASVTVLIASSQEAVASTATTLGDGVTVWEGFLFEAVFTAIFLVVILKASASASSAGTAFLAISLTLVVIHLCLIPFTGTSVNPARSLGPGIVGSVWTDQWIYWTAPLVGAIVGWAIYRFVAGTEQETDAASAS